MTVYAPLFSHDASPFKPSRILTTIEAANEYGRAVCKAQPGVEFEPMRFLPGADDWKSLLSGETPTEVQRRRWQNPAPAEMAKAWGPAGWAPAHPIPAAKGQPRP